MTENIKKASDAIQAEITMLLCRVNELQAIIVTLESPKTKPLGLCLTLSEANMLSTDGIVPAIKALRERTQCGLKEAKDTADRYIRDRGLIRTETATKIFYRVP